METLKDLFELQMCELYSIEYQSLQIMSVIIDFAKNPKFKVKLKHHLGETAIHIQRVEAICKDLGISPEKDSSKTMLQMGRDGRQLVQNNLHTGVQDSALLALSERMEHYEIACYESALQHARKLGDNYHVELLDRTLEEEYDAEEELSSLRERGWGINHLWVT